MERKSTGDLRLAMDAAAGLDQYIRENEGSFSDRSLQELLGELYARRPESKAGLARRSGMSEVYLHQVFSGRRKPSRDRLLCLCVGMKLSLEETQRLLDQATYARLYPRVRRDAVICYGVIHGMPLDQINEALYRQNEPTLC